MSGNTLKVNRWTCATCGKLMSAATTLGLDALIREHGQECMSPGGKTIFEGLKEFARGIS